MREVFPDRVDLIVEVAAAANQELDRAVLAPNGTVAFYAGTNDDVITLPVRELMTANLRWQGLFLFSVPAAANALAVEAVSAAVADGALRTGADAGLPLITFGLDDVGKAQDAVLDAAVIGKPLVVIR